MKARYFAPFVVAAISIGAVRADSASIAVQVDKLRDQMNYAWNGPTIEPDDKHLMRTWKGGGALSEYEPWFSKDARTLINFILSNPGTENLRINATYLQVSKSSTDLQPLLSLRYVWGQVACNANLVSTKFKVKNYGWSSPTSARVEVAFSSTYDAQLATPATLNTSVVGVDVASANGHQWEIDLEAALTKLGANTAQLKAWSKSLYDQTRGKTSGVYQSGICTGDDAECQSALKSASALGTLGNAIVVKKGSVMTTAAGAIVYSWRDAEGATHSYRAPFSTRINLGARDATCTPPTADPFPTPPWGPVEVPELTLADLKLDQRDYRIEVPVRGVLQANKRFTLKLAVRSSKSALSRFKLVFDTDRGLISSGDVALQSFVARYEEQWRP
jgi:hypothetical protein